MDERKFKKKTKLKTASVRDDPLSSHVTRGDRDVLDRRLAFVVIDATRDDARDRESDERCAMYDEW
jgi:hypothetical protein